MKAGEKIVDHFQAYKRYTNSQLDNIHKNVRMTINTAMVMHFPLIATIVKVCCVRQLHSFIMNVLEKHIVYVQMMTVGHYDL